MTNKEFTYVAIVLDESGSMKSLAPEVISGFNGFLAEQKKIPGKCVLRLTQFSRSTVDIEGQLRVRVAPIADFVDLNDGVYSPMGGTPLFDAVMLTIRDVGVELAAMPEAERPAHVLFIINTDGEENASQNVLNLPLGEGHKYLDMAQAMNGMIHEQEEQWQWRFIYMGVGLDKMTHERQAATMGVKAVNTLSYEATQQGVTQSYRGTSGAVTSTRTGG